MLVSVLFPFVHISVKFTPTYNNKTFGLLQLLEGTQWEEEVTIHASYQRWWQTLDWQHLAWIAYVLIGLVLLLLFARSLYYISQLRKKYIAETI
jgi:4-amino-4-deoxy-L-arabinose transferase-like glycosyltransferase